MRIDAGNVLELPATGACRSAKAEGALAGVCGTHAGSVAIDTLAEHDPHAVACFLFAELSDAFGDFSWGIYVQESLVPRTRVERLVHVAPLAEAGGCGGVDFFVELCAAVVLHAVFDGSDGEDEEDGNGSGLRRSGSKDGKDWGTLEGACTGRDALTLDDDEGEKVNVGYSVKGREWARTRRVGGPTGGTAQRGSWVGM